MLFGPKNPGSSGKGAPRGPKAIGQYSGAFEAGEVVMPDTTEETQDAEQSEPIPEIPEYRPEPGTSTEAEASLSPTERPARATTMDEMLNRQGFADFLAESKDAEHLDMGDEAAISGMYHAFEDMHEATDRFQDFLAHNEHFQSLGIDFSVGEMSDKMFEHFKKMAYEDPGTLSEMTKTSRMYDQTNAAIASTEKNLVDQFGTISEATDLEQTLAFFKQKRETLTVAHDASGFFNRQISGLKALYEKLAWQKPIEDSEKWLATHEGDPNPGWYTRDEKAQFIEEHQTYRREHDALVATREQYYIKLNPAAITSSIERLNKAIQDTEQSIEQQRLRGDTQKLIDDARLQAADTHQRLSSFVGSIVCANKDIRNLAWSQVEAKLFTTSGRSTDEAFDFIEKVRGSADLQMFGKEDTERAVATWSKEIQEHVEESTDESIRSAIAATSIGSNGFRALEHSLTEFIVSERVGLREGVDAREFIVTTLQDVVDKNKAPQDRAKNLLIKAMIAKLSVGLPQKEMPAPAPTPIPEPTPAPIEAAPASVPAPAPQERKRHFWQLKPRESETPTVVAPVTVAEKPAPIQKPVPESVREPVPKAVPEPVPVPVQAPVRIPRPEARQVPAPADDSSVMQNFTSLEDAMQYQEQQNEAESRRQNEYTETVRTSFRNYASTLEAFIDDMRKSGFNNLQMDTEAVRRLTQGEFDPEAAGNVITSIGLAFNRRFNNGSGQTDTAIAQYTFAADRIEELRQNTRQLGEIILGARGMMKQSTYDDLAIRINGAMNLMRERQRGLNESRLALSRYLGR